MKRFNLFLILFLCISSFCYSSKELGDFSKEVKIQGGYDAVASINVTPIASQAEAYKIGMPFSLDDPSVKHGQSEFGRLIAYWDVLANFKIKMDIVGGVMHHYSQGKDSEYNPGLGYYITFKYKMSYYDENGQLKYQEDHVTLHVSYNELAPEDKSDKVENVDLLQDRSVDVNSLVGSALGEVFFQFDETTSTQINSEAYKSYPNGNYLAEITLTIKPF